MPAPMMQTSVRTLSLKRDGDGVSAVAIQMEVLACESSLIELPPLLRRSSDVYVDSFVTAKPATSKHKQGTDYKDHKDHQDRYHSSIRRTASIVCHIFSSQLNLNWPLPHFRPLSFHHLAKSRLPRSRNSNPLQKRSKQMPVRSLPVAQAASSVCLRQTWPRRPAFYPRD